jgi:DNA polymerase-3 subunit epsilon
MKSLLHYDELVLFDVETTGLDFLNHHIIELGCISYAQVDGQFILHETMNRLIFQHTPLLEKIIELTGIDDLLLKNEGVDESIAMFEFHQKFISPSNIRRLYMAYNAHFDIPFITKALSSYGLSFPMDVDFLDLLTVYKDRATYPHKLLNAIHHYGIGDQVQNSHRALDDCLASYLVLLSMGQERDDLSKYINLFGYNPSYPPNRKIPRIRYKPQAYHASNRLYESQ